MLGVILISGHSDEHHSDAAERHSNECHSDERLSADCISKLFLLDIILQNAFLFWVILLDNILVGGNPCARRHFTVSLSP